MNFSKNIRLFYPVRVVKLGQCSEVEHEIDSGDATPVKLPPYRTSYAERVFIQQQVDEVVADKIIQPTSSPWSFPVILVKKKRPEEET